MNILILRHGEAEAFSDKDYNRHLTDNGRQQIQGAAKCLQSLGISFDQAWISPYRRTQQTADEALSILTGIPRKTQDFLVPESDPSNVINAIDSSGLDNLLIISHQPLVSALVGTMIDADPRLGSPMSPASMAYVNADVMLPGCCSLSWLRHAPNFDISE